MDAILNETVNDKGLRNLIKLFSQKMPSVKVGILADHNSRNDGHYNATIGAIHEFGSPKKRIPMRSFLRVPLMDNLQKAVDKIKKQKTLSITELINQIGLFAVGIVQAAFHNEGYGKWFRTKKQGNTLVDTAQLRDSISYEVVQ